MFAGIVSCRITWKAREDLRTPRRWRVLVSCLWRRGAVFVGGGQSVCACLKHYRVRDHVPEQRHSCRGANEEENGRDGIGLINHHFILTPPAGVRGAPYWLRGGAEGSVVCRRLDHFEERRCGDIRGGLSWWWRAWGEETPQPAYAGDPLVAISGVMRLVCR